jgi:hypothetical protein
VSTFRKTAKGGADFVAIACTRDQSERSASPPKSAIRSQSVNRLTAAFHPLSCHPTGGPSFRAFCERVGLPIPATISGQQIFPGEDCVGCWQIGPSVTQILGAVLSGNLYGALQSMGAVPDTGINCTYGLCQVNPVMDAEPAQNNAFIENLPTPVFQRSYLAYVGCVVNDWMSFFSDELDFSGNPDISGGTAYITSATAAATAAGTGRPWTALVFLGTNATVTFSAASQIRTTCTRENWNPQYGNDE